MNDTKLLKKIALVATLSASLLHGENASAVPLQLLLEADEDAAGGSEIFIASFDSLEDLVNFDLADSAFSDIDISPGFSVGGFTFDGSYQLLLESDADDSGGSEIFLATFDTLDDLLNFDLADSAFSDIDISPGFSVGGFTFDGSYQLLLESDADDSGGSEIFLATFDTLDDFLNFDLADSAFSDIDISPGFSVGGFTFGGSYQLLLESDADDSGGSEIFLATFDTLDDFLNFDLANSTFSDIDISPGFSVGGLAAVVPEVAEVPEPASVMLLGVGLLVLCFFALQQRPRPRRKHEKSFELTNEERFVRRRQKEGGATAAAPLQFTGRTQT